MGYFDKIYIHEKKTGNLLDITRLDKEHYEIFLETVVRVRDAYNREIERGATFDTGDRQLTIPDVTNCNHEYITKGLPWDNWQECKKCGYVK